jgi:hypothetical protein
LPVYLLLLSVICSLFFYYYYYLLFLLLFILYSLFFIVIVIVIILFFIMIYYSYFLRRLTVETLDCRCRRKPGALGAGRIHSCFFGKHCSRSELNPSASVFREKHFSSFSSYQEFQVAESAPKKEQHPIMRP